ncbi:MAG TPA: hypothetical protein VIU15_39775 [Streptomyces sp.]
MTTAKCHCDQPDADPYACPAEPEDCSGEFLELNPHSGTRPVDVASAKVSRTCPTCGWQTETWHIDDGSAEADLHKHVTRAHSGSYKEKASATE